MSYPDTQRYRLGGNYLLLPVNAPKTPYRPGEYDGTMNFMIRNSPINYYPSRYSKANVSKSDINGLDNTPFQDGVTRVRSNLPKTDNFSQAGARYRWFNEARKQRFITRVGTALMDVK